MKSLVKVGYIIGTIIFIIYLSVPNQYFPEKPEDALQSDEPADTESTQRRAYFTNYDRCEVMQHYTNQMKIIKIFGTVLPTYRLIYPPEEAQTIIRDQTRSTYLEEVVHPFRESIYVNGFEPKTQKDSIIIQDKIWEQKIIIKQIESNVIMRIIIGLLTILITPLVLSNFTHSLTEFGKGLPRLWTYR